jgi:hypothetical protein
MANTTFKNATGGVEYNKSTGAGTDPDPKVMAVAVDSMPAVKGTPFDVSATLTVTNGAPAVGHCASAIINWPDVVSKVGGSGLINTIIVAGVVPVTYNLWLFNAATATSYAKDEAFILVVADELKCVGTVPIAAIDYAGDHGSIFYVATIRGLGLQFTAAAADTDLYGWLVNTGTTSPATTTIYVRLIGEYIN